MIEEISVAQLEKLLEAGADLVDVREVKERQEEALPFPSKHWPLSSLGLYKADISQEYSTVFYCSTGMRSAIAAEIAGTWTPQVVFSLRGGIAHGAHQIQEQKAI